MAAQGLDVADQFAVVLASRLTLRRRRAAGCGRIALVEEDNPERFGMNIRRAPGVQPDPGPPCSTTAGRPCGLPQTS